ncbi:hypothetical protein [Agathobaculum sp. Marseille-P7918]|uniref:hypothetical protein n=1 Tax=Agathobaculum sp. Marseille-P7918 TaxID=2479843 RepID=UPI0035699DE7
MSNADNFEKHKEEGVPMKIIRFNEKMEVIEEISYHMGKFQVTEAQLDELASALWPSLKKFYEDPENCRQFEEYMKQKESSQNTR